MPFIWEAESWSENEWRIEKGAKIKGSNVILYT